MVNLLKKLKYVRNQKHFLFNTSSITNLFDGRSNYFGIGNVGDTTPSYVVRINSKGTSMSGEVAECQALPVVVSTKIDQQPYHSESINIAVTVEDQSFRKDSNSEIVEYGVYLGTDSGSATNNTKHISTDNKVRKMYWTAIQTGAPGVERAGLDFIEARTLTKVDPSNNRTGTTSPYTSSTFEFISASDSVTYAQTTDRADYNITYLSSSLTGSWDTYTGLDITGSYYAWGYASSSLGLTTGSMQSFTTYPKNITTYVNNSIVGTPNPPTCVDCNNPLVEITYGSTRISMPITGSETYPNGVYIKPVYSSPALTGQVPIQAVSSQGWMYSNKLPDLQYGYLVSQSNWTALDENAFIEVNVASNKMSQSLDIFYCPDECP